ncbi:hypothetical protein GQR58_007600 [Nymphon striatum]|nr:hypothetical protein GQR58_007600 [Nymphon striatum]
MLFLIILGIFPEKFSFGLCFAPSESNTLQLRAYIYSAQKNHKIFLLERILFFIGLPCPIALQTLSYTVSCVVIEVHTHPGQAELLDESSSINHMEQVGEDLGIEDVYPLPCNPLLHTNIVVRYADPPISAQSADYWEIGLQNVRVSVLEQDVITCPWNDADDLWRYNWASPENTGSECYVGYAVGYIHFLEKFFPRKWRVKSRSDRGESGAINKYMPHRQRLLTAIVHHNPTVKLPMLPHYFSNDSFQLQKERIKFQKHSSLVGLRTTIASLYWAKEPHTV